MSQWRRLLRDVDDGKRERLRGHIQLWIRRMLIAAGQAADGRTLTDRRRRRYNAGCCRFGSHVFHVGLFLTCGPNA